MTSLTTELEAVNFLLKTIGESPVNDLDNPQLSDAMSAKTTLRQVSKREQSRGYHFNTDEKYQLLPNVDGEFTVPTDALRIDPTHTSISIDAVQRGTKMWDRKNHTFVFTQSSMYCDIVRHYSWDELPEPVRQYFIYQSAVEFYHETFQTDPDEAIIKGLGDSQASFEDFISATSDYNALYSNLTTFNTLKRKINGGW